MFDNLVRAVDYETVLLYNCSELKSFIGMHSRLAG